MKPQRLQFRTDKKVDFVFISPETTTVTVIHARTRFTHQYTGSMHYPVRSRSSRATPTPRYPTSAPHECSGGSTCVGEASTCLAPKQGQQRTASPSEQKAHLCSAHVIPTIPECERFQWWQLVYRGNPVSSAAARRGVEDSGVVFSCTCTPLGMSCGLVM